ncbi:MAG: hypothetical protein B7Y41_07665 [Hydrogenophilales bacterium 28-61-23]|nr:MAG: hypothetical protein B7Y41_07665 [Hydrogenophilales bacterium 28-61-23]
MMLKSTNNSENRAPSSVKRAWFLFTLTIGTMIAVMTVSVFYPFPSGNKLGVWDFIQLWFREIIIVGFILIVLVGIGVRWLWRLLRRHEQWSKRPGSTS